MRQDAAEKAKAALYWLGVLAFLAGTYLLIRQFPWVICCALPHTM